LPICFGESRSVERDVPLTTRHHCSHLRDPTHLVVAATDRFLVHIERCLTFHNEHPADVPFPEWIDPSWHNCLVGCMVCQKVCPANKKVLNWIEPGPIFSEDETKLLVKGTILDDLPSDTKKKIN